MPSEAYSEQVPVRLKFVPAKSTKEPAISMSFLLELLLFMVDFLARLEMHFWIYQYEACRTWLCLMNVAEDIHLRQAVRHLS